MAEKQLKDYSVNEKALQIIEEELLPKLDRIGGKILVLPSGARVIDLGIDNPGGFIAGKLFVEIGLGGLGKLTYGTMQLNEQIVPSIRITVSAPGIAELASHVAYLKIPYGDETVVISGPIRALDAGKDVFSKAVDYTDHSKKAVGLIQTEKLPDDTFACLVADRVKIKPENLTLIVARTGCMTGAVQVCARNVEQSLPSIVDRGFDINQVIEGMAVTPMVSVTEDEEIAYGRVNDCLIYGQETTLYVDCEDEAIKSMLDDLAFSKNEDIYGIEFQELFRRCGNSWANVPRAWDAPCKVNFINQRTGRSYSVGSLHKEVLEQSFMGKEGVITG